METNRPRAETNRQEEQEREVRGRQMVKGNREIEEAKENEKRRKLRRKIEKIEEVEGKTRWR